MMVQTTRVRVWRQCATGCVALFFAGFSSPAAWADSVILQAARDNTLYEIFDGTVSNGQGGEFFAGMTLANLTRRGIIQFDLSVLPPNAQIDSVALTLHMSRSVSLAQDVSLHRVQASWGEANSVGPGEGGSGAHSKSGDATWIHRFYSNTFWQHAGGDFDEAASAITSVMSNGFYTWAGDGMLQDAQNWLANPDANFGWVVKGEERFAGTAKRFDSRENADFSVRPVLLIDYHIVPTPTSLAGWTGLLIAAARRRR